ncbi:hypothetical protein WH47_00247 [Habropoda laboriosa]|uniref:Transmembrane protein n=1 Tax=Habropoda laboriosa TaxID=597456 RepID=A0A0L7R1M2_9HYME|nr:hypothetical protein WH47_00247 [Habropoda laboriosa]
MVLVQRGPQDTGKEYPRTVEDASLPSSSSSWPPLRRVSLLLVSSLVFLPCLLSFLLVNTPLPSPIRISLLLQKGTSSSPSNATHQERDIIPSPFTPFSLAFFSSPFFFFSSPVCRVFSLPSFSLLRFLRSFLSSLFNVRETRESTVCLRLSQQQQQLTMVGSVCRETFVRIAKSRALRGLWSRWRAQPCENAPRVFWSRRRASKRRRWSVRSGERNRTLPRLWPLRSLEILSSSSLGEKMQR